MTPHASNTCAPLAKNSCYKYGSDCCMRCGLGEIKAFFIVIQYEIMKRRRYEPGCQQYLL